MSSDSLINEMSKDARSIGRRYGRSRKGRRAEKKQVFVRGRRTSTEALLTLDGIAAGTVVEGSMTKELFLEYLEFNVVSYMSSMLESLRFDLILAPEMHSLSWTS
jgi:hypothetical protein